MDSVEFRRNLALNTFEGVLDCVQLIQDLIENRKVLQMGPSVTSTYDVDLELDGAAGASTCERVEGGWVATSQTGSGKFTGVDS